MTHLPHHCHSALKNKFHFTKTNKFLYLHTAIGNVCIVRITKHLYRKE